MNEDIQILHWEIFWGGANKGVAKPRGTSVLITNTNAGEKLYKIIKPKIVSKEICEKYALKNNKSYYQSCTVPINRKKVFDLYNTDYKRMFEEKCLYAESSLIERVIQKIQQIFLGVLNRFSKQLYLERNNKHRSFIGKIKCCGCGVGVSICPT